MVCVRAAQVYTLLDRRYKKNLKRLFVVHPSTWLSRVLFVWCARVLISDKFWSKLTYITKVSNLYKHFDASQIALPNSVYRYDRRAARVRSISEEEARGEKGSK